VSQDQTRAQPLTETPLRTAEMPLAVADATLASELLAVWLPAADELSRKMSAIEHMALLPITVFSHAAPDADV
jgi:hypothetical protein